MVHFPEEVGLYSVSTPLIQYFAASSVEGTLSGRTMRKPRNCASVWNQMLLGNCGSWIFQDLSDACRAAKNYPHAVRGGSWNDEAPKLRSAARLASDKSWKIQDPQSPKSIWFHTDAQFLGFRIVRPLKVPSTEEAAKYWINGVENE